MLSDLIERVKKATGPDRELDANVMNAIARKPSGRWLAEDDPWQNKEDDDLAPEVTSDLSAAVALTERVLPGCDWSLERYADNAWAFVSGHSAEAPTPALALVLATLMAVQAKEATDA